ncbi:MAG TPA: nucleotidyltransferase domain-containing protein [Longimicrobiales bacterium]|nr:nucleotidyltransferase domain-containing protein [Longimicrobiales bacterium]
MLNLLDHILGSESKVQVLRALFPLDTLASGRETQRLGGIRSNAGAQRALDELSDLHVLERTEAGGAHLYQINKAHHLYEALAGLFEREEGSLDVVRTELARALGNAGKGPEILSVVVFGSVATGTASPGSDLDVLVLTEEKAATSVVEKRIRAAAAPLSRRLGLLLSPYVLSRADASFRYEDGDPLMQAIMTEGRTLIGEPLHDLLS